MPVFALDQRWSDFFTEYGFYVGVIGLLIGVIGFGYTIYQVRKTTAAAVAAEQAAEKTLAEVRTSFRRFIGGLAHRLLAEVRSAVESGNWSLAALRSNDLADMIGQLPEPTSRSITITHGFREFALEFAARTKEPKAKFAGKKWQKLILEASSLIDSVQSPFARPKGEEHGSDRPTPQARPEATGQDAGEGGELDRGGQPGT